MMTLPVALQLYTVRDEMARDPAGTLKRVADIGYENVECAGLAGLSVEAFRQACDAAGLSIVSAHQGLPEGGAVGAFVADMRTLGTAFTVTGIPGELRGSAGGYRTHAKRCEEAAFALGEAGITLCYHNHSFEFERFDGTYGLDILYQSSAPDSLQAQIDLYWVQHGGEDPAAYILKWKDRCKLLHLKDMAGDETRSFAEVGEGILDWPSIFRAAEEIKPAWYIVEQDVCAGPSLESAEISFDNLKAWGYA